MGFGVTPTTGEIALKHAISNHWGIAAFQQLFLKKQRIQFLKAAGFERQNESENPLSVPTVKDKVKDKVTLFQGREGTKLTPRKKL